MREVDASELAGLAMRATTVFDEPAFAARNTSRADRVVHLVLGEPATRLGLVAGICGSQLRAPFSAPWSLPLLAKARPRVRDFLRAAEDLASAPDTLGIAGVDLVLPSPHVAADVVAKWSSALALAGFRTLPPDLSFHLVLEDGDKALDPKARQKLRAARSREVRLRLARDDADRATAYRVIQDNRTARAIPLHLSLDDLLAMASFLPVDFFILEEASGPAAAAVCYRLSTDLAYLVYWGDVPESPSSHPMNLLAAELSAHYARSGFAILDTGIASIAGEPQQGLADFKQSIGGIASLRARFALP